MKRKSIKKWIRQHNNFVTVVSATLGFVLFFWGFFVKKEIELLGDLLMEVGLAFITNALLLFFSLLYFKEDEALDDAKILFEECGLLRIYPTKKEMNQKINGVLLPNYKVLEYDIVCCGGLTTLRKYQGQKLIEYIKTNHMRIRVLTANPYLDYLLQKKIDEECAPSNAINYSTIPITNDIKREIFDLYTWINEQKSELPKELQDNLQIRFYNTLPPMQYHRVGNSIFIGQSLIGFSSQSSPAFEFINTNNPDDYFSKFASNFESLWNDPNLTQPTTKVKLNPRTMIDNTIIDNILKLSSLDISSDLDSGLEKRIGAVFTVCGYPKPLEDNKQRRFNTNIVRGGEKVDIRNSNGIPHNGRKPGYYSMDETQVVGRCIRDGQIKFEVTCERNRYSILAIPFKNTDGEIVAAVTYEFEYDCNRYLSITKEDQEGKDILHNNRAIVDKAKKWADLLSIYLHIEEI